MRRRYGRYLIGLLFMILAATARAEVLRVPSEFGTIQQAIQAAQAGDVVSVAPGTYSNCPGGPCTPAIAMMKSGVDLVSDAGPETTILRIDQAAGGLASVEGHGVADCVLEGFTITGTAAGYRGAVFLGSTDIVVRNCRFVDLAGGVWHGGGLGANIADIRVEDCEFLRCVATEGAGFSMNFANVELIRCHFEECVGGAASLNGHRSFTATVSDCVFRNNTENSALQVLEGYQAEIVGNRFEGNSSSINGTAITVQNSDGFVLLKDNVFLGNDSSQFRSTIHWQGPGDIVGNTFVGNVTSPGWGVISDNWSQEGSRSMYNNLFAHNEGLAYETTSGPLGFAGCNLFWQNTGGDYEGYVIAPTDLFVDPLLCDPTTGDVTLQASSPCLPENSNGCERIGALGQGCGAVSVERASWGKVKTRYRQGEVR